LFTWWKTVCVARLQALSEEIILTLGEAFEVAYQIALRNTASACPEPESVVANATPNTRRVIPYSTAL